MISYKKISAPLLLLTIISCNTKERENTSTNQQPINVTTIVAGDSVSTGIKLSGQIEASQAANISTRIMGYITKVYVNIGDRVKEGQILFSINNADILAKKLQAEAALAQAEAVFANAEKDYNRYSTLFKEQSASAKELENITTQYKAAKAGVDAAKQMKNEALAQLTYANVTAPFSGIITQKMLDAGNIANPGMPVLALESNATLRMSALVPESEINNIETGMNADITVDAAGETLQGKVIEISSSSRLTGGQYVAKISVTNSNKLHAGMYALATIEGTKSKVTEGNIYIPKNALINKGGLTGVYTIENGNTAILHWLKTGKTIGEKVEILAGLKNGEQIIENADRDLFNGAPVKTK